jgi:hypothetical protein
MVEKEITPLHQALAARFGEHRVQALPRVEGEIPLLLLDLELASPVTVLMTNGLSDYNMPVPERLQNRNFNEIYFCLPSYWEWEDTENPQMNWVFPWIKRLAKYVVDKQSWFGPGHTMPCGVTHESLSATMKQNHFFLTDPIYLDQELTPLKVGEKTVYFLGIIPIFEDEMDYKSGKGTFKLLQKLSNAGVTEKLDDYRGTVLRSKWRLLKRS